MWRWSSCGPPGRGWSMTSIVCPLEEQRLDVAAGEGPLDARVGILDEGLHEEPRPLDVEAEEPLALLVPGESIVADADEAGALDGGAIERGQVEQEVGVAPGAMREVRQELATVARREIADPEDRAGPLARDDGRGPLDRLHEAREPVVAIVLSQPPVAFAFGGQLGGRRQDTAMRHPDGSPELRGEGRGRARAAAREEQRRGEPEQGSRAHGQGSSRKRPKA